MSGTVLRQLLRKPVLLLPLLLLGDRLRLRFQRIGGTVSQVDDLVAAGFFDQLRGFIRRRVSNDADVDDILQDVLVKLVENARQVSETSVHAWLFAVTRNAIVDAGRKRRRLAELDEGSVMDATNEEESVSAELAQCLKPLRRLLSEGDNQLLTSVDEKGDSQSKLAQELGVSSSTLKSRVQRARRRLRDILEACCSVDQDTRGRPVDFRHKPGSDCPCH